MMVPWINTFVHFGADFDSDYEEEESLRKIKSEPMEWTMSDERRSHAGSSTDAPRVDRMSTIGIVPGAMVKQRQSKEVPASTMMDSRSRSKGGSATNTRQADCMSTIDTLPGFRLHAVQTLGTLESLPSVFNDEYEPESMRPSRGYPTARSADSWCRPRTIDDVQGLRMHRMEMYGTLEAIRSVSDVETESDLEEQLCQKNTFIDITDKPESESELPMRCRCGSDPGPAQASIEVDPELAEYAAMLRSRASKLRGMLQSTSLDQDLSQKCDTIMCKESHSNAAGVTPTLPVDPGDGHSTIAWLPSLKEGSGDFNSSMGPEEVQPAGLSRPVTTLMVCNLPCKLSSEGLKEAVDQLGFEGLYDLIYVPRGSINSMGYGFVNFVEPEVAARFSHVMSAYRFGGDSKKQPYCKVAERQGLKCNLRKIYRGTNFRRRAQAPLLT